MFKIELNGEIAIVTGAARGIGKALVESLFGAGASVFAVDKIDTAMLDLTPQAQKQKLMQRNLII